MKTKIEIKNRLTGAILFEFETVNNTIKKTLLEAIKQDANLRYADLQNSDLRYADLQNSDLRYANLQGANLQGANLRYANLRYANLQDANLQGANLQGANLQGANLQGANLREANLQDAKTDKRYIQISCIGSAKRITTYCFEDDKIWCGCFTGTLAEFEKQANKTHANNEQYLKEYLGFINYLKSLK